MIHAQEAVGANDASAYTDGSIHRLVASQGTQAAHSPTQYMQPSYQACSEPI